HPEEECLYDGGDRGTPVGLDREGRLLGLDPADTVAEYTTGPGKRQLAVSNRVCVCVPRFTVLRTQLLPSGYDPAPGVGAEATAQAQSVMRTHLPSVAATQRDQVVAVSGRERPSQLRATVRAVYVDQTWGVATVVGERETHEMVGTLQEERPLAPARPL